MLSDIRPALEDEGSAGFFIILPSGGSCFTGQFGAAPLQGASTRCPHAVVYSTRYCCPRWRHGQNQCRQTWSARAVRRHRLRKTQRGLSRKKRGSGKQRKAVRRVTRIQKWVADDRKDFFHKHSTIIVKSNGMVVVETLKVRNMSASAKGTAEVPGQRVRQKAGLNRAILDQGWGMFRNMLGYKLAYPSGRLAEVPAAYTSQTFSACGLVDATLRQGQAWFVSTGCGHRANADSNAGLNILRRMDSALKHVEGHRTKRPG